MSLGQQHQELVFNTLSRALSQDAHVLKPAEQELKGFEIQPQFYSILCNIFQNCKCPSNIRWLAVLYFKNGVDRYWRPNANYGISEDEKKQLRKQLISKFDEAVPQISMQVAVLIGKIARLDCPRLWPELVPTLIEVIRNGSLDQHQGALLTFYHVTKTLASKRLGHDRKAFQELSGNLFSFILELWQYNSNTYFTMLSESSKDIARIQIFSSNALLALKVLRKFLIYGFIEPQHDHHANIFIQTIFKRIPDHLQAKNVVASLSDVLITKRERHLITLTKVLLDMMEYHPEGFIAYIQSSLEMSVSYNLADQNKEFQFERFTVNTLNLMRSILRTEMYRPAKNIEDTKNQMTIEAHTIKSQFFTDANLAAICRHLILNYFSLTEDELHSWQEFPEDFMSDDVGDAWKYSLKPCAENLFLTLMKEYRPSLIPVVLQLMQQLQESQTGTNLKQVLDKDAVYNAIGLASFDLCEDVNFDQWFVNYLQKELVGENESHLIIKRRVIWLVGRWVGVRFSNTLRPVLYQILLALLEPQQDLVVRLESAKTLQSAIDDFEFDKQAFLPFLEKYFWILFQLLKAVDESETKMLVLNVMAFMTERVGSHIRPYAGSLLQYLPDLWLDAEEHNMLRCVILVTLSHLVQGLNEESPSIHGFLLPTIHTSTDFQQDAHVYLLEDGLDLWEITLNCASVLSKELLALYKNMLSILENSSESLKICINITECYLLLNAELFLQSYGGSLCRTLLDIMTDMRSEGIISILQIIDTAIQVVPELAPRVFNDFIQTVFNSLLNHELEPAQTTSYLCIIARIILQNSSSFMEMISFMSTQSNIQGEALLERYIDGWINKMDDIVQPEKRKLNVMAMLVMLQFKQLVVLKRYGDIINCCVEAMHDVCHEEQPGEMIDGLILREDEQPSEDLTLHEQRARMLRHKDSVHKVHLVHFVAEQLSFCEQQCDEQIYAQMLENVDKEIMQQLVSFIPQS